MIWRYTYTYTYVYVRTCTHDSHFHTYTYSIWTMSNYVRFAYAYNIIIITFKEYVHINKCAYCTLQWYMRLHTHAHARTHSHIIVDTRIYAQSLNWINTCFMKFEGLKTLIAEHASCSQGNEQQKGNADERVDCRGSVLRGSGSGRELQLVGDL